MKQVLKQQKQSKKAEISKLVVILIGLLAFILMLAIYGFVTGKMPNLLRVFDLL